MYCKYCGKEIDDDAKFCKYCGKPSKQNFTIRISNSVYVYLIWLILNISVWVVKGDEYKYAKHSFYPFESSYIGYYDISEFLIYAIVLPAFIYLCVRFCKEHSLFSKVRTGFPIYKNENRNVAKERLSHLLSVLLPYLFVLDCIIAFVLYATGALSAFSKTCEWNSSLLFATLGIFIIYTSLFYIAFRLLKKWLVPYGIKNCIQYAFTLAFLSLVITMTVLLSGMLWHSDYNESFYDNVEENNNNNVNDYIQDTFYGCTLGDDRESVIATLTEKGFIVKPEKNDTYIKILSKDGIIELGEFFFTSCYLDFTKNKLSDITFYQYEPNKSAAINDFDRLKNIITSIYNFKNLPSPDSDVYARKIAKGKNGVVCTIAACVLGDDDVWVTLNYHT